MAQQVINIGTAADDHTGDPIRTSFNKTNQNFTELYSSSGGTIIAGSTPTTGFTAGQLMVSDGTVTRPVDRTVTTSWGDATYPMYMSSNASGAATIWMSATNYPGAFGIGFQLFSTANFGISMSGSSGYFGFNTGDNWVTTQPNIAFVPDATGGQSIAAFRNVQNSALATTVRFYNKVISAGNAEWGGIDWITTANTLTIGAQKSGTGVLRAATIVGSTVTLNAAGANKLTVSSTLITAAVPVVLPTYTFSTLPASPVVGETAFITDCTVATFASAAAGGGSNKVPVYYDGAWKVG